VVTATTTEKEIVMKAMLGTTPVWAVRASIAALVTVTLTSIGGDSARAEGLTATGAQIFDQNTAGIDDDPEAGDNFGSRLATGDFNGDGSEDLAIGAPLEDLGGLTDTGAVNVLYGDASGLHGGSQSQWYPPLEAFTGGRFGIDLVAGDFNGDGYDDLAVAYLDEPGTPDIRRAVLVRRGSATGLFSYMIALSPFQTAGPMAVGDLNADGYDDLIISGSEITPAYEGWIAYTGSPTGSGLVEANGENVGSIPTSLATGQLDGDSGDELIAGYPLDGPNGGGQAVIYLEPLVSALSETWHQDSPGIQGSSEAGDQFGAALAVGDFNGDGCGDLQVGVPGEDFPEIDMGVYQEIFGDCSGLTDAGDILVGDTEVQAGARFGSALAAGNFDEADLFPEIASSAPAHDVGATADAGRVRIRWTTATTTTIWHQDVAGVPDAAEAGDRFGSSLATGDFNGDGADDLAIGVPLEDVNGNADAGAVNILYGTPAGPQDSDQDGCLDTAEQQTATGSETSGGLRNHLNFWDFFDTPDPNTNVRDKSVAGTDFFRVLGRFGSSGSASIDPLSATPAAPAYHTTYDRGSSSGPNAWNLTAANGAVAGTDFFSILTQFGHSCA
jgi:hypothetical protein